MNVSSRLTRREVSILFAGMALGASGCEESQPGRATSPKPPAPPTGSSGAVGARGNPGVSEGAIKVGSYGPLSGPDAAWGAVLHAMNAYFTHINDAGGIHGRRIDFVYRDDQLNPAKTPALVRELVETEDVFAMIGGIGTANGRAVADYLEKKDVPNFSPCSGDQLWSRGTKKNVYTAYPRFVSEGELLANYVARDLGMKKVAVLYQNDDYGKQGLEGVKRGLGRYAGAAVGLELSLQPSDEDLSGQVSKIAQEAPEALILFCGAKQAAAAVKMLHEQDKKPQVLTSFLLSDPSLLELGGEAWEGVISAAIAKLPDSDDETVVQYREILERNGGGKLTPGISTQLGFILAMPFVEALQRAGRDLTHAKLYRALQSFEAWTGPGPHFKGQGMGPPITFSSERRLGNDAIFLIRAEAQRWAKISDWMSMTRPSGKPAGSAQAAGGAQAASSAEPAAAAGSASP